jgi:hypothetical protein
MSATRHGPSRGELKFRLAVSLAGLALLAVALLTRQVSGIAWIEVALIGGAFFGGSAALSLRALLREGRA